MRIQLTVAACALGWGIAMTGQGLAQEPAGSLAIEMPSNVGGEVTSSLQVTTPSDGHLLLLNVWGDGHLRVLFPRRPSSSSFLRAGHYDFDKISSGSLWRMGGEGTFVAVWSQHEFNYGDFVRYGHWAVSDLNHRQFAEDPAAAVTALVNRMEGQNAKLVTASYDWRPAMIPATELVRLEKYPRESNRYRELENYLRIQRGCPSGTRDVTGAGEYCTRPEPPRRAPTVVSPPEPVYIPPANPQSPPARTATPAAPYVPPRHPL